MQTHRMNLLQIATALCLLGAGVPAMPVAAQDSPPGCVQCPVDGECPRSSASEAPSCPCPPEGECPRDGLIFNLLSDAQRLALGDELLNLRDTVAGAWALSTVPDEIIAYGKRNDALVGLPVALDQFNIMWLNEDVLRNVGGEPPQSVEALIDLMERAGDNGITPIAMGGASWERVLLFRSLLAAEGFAAYSKALIERDPEAIMSPQFTQALEHFAKIMEIADASSMGQLSWDAAAMAVASDRALLQVTGSWALPLYKQTGVAVKCFPFPGTGSGIVFGAPTMFGQVISPEAGRSNLDFVADRNFRVGFATANRSLPVTESGQVLSATCNDEGDAFMDAGAAAQNGALVPASPVALSPGDIEFNQQLEEILGELSVGIGSIEEAPLRLVYLPE